MKKVLTVFSIVLIASFVLAACATPAPATQAPAAPADTAAPAAPADTAAPAAKQIKICFAFQDLETEFWMAGHKAITETLKAKGYDVIEANSNEDANKQLEQVKNCIAQGVDGIIVIPVDGAIALTLIAEANKANIPIGIFNRPPNSKDGNADVIVANNEKIAQAAVQYMADEAKKLGKKMTPLLMVGDLNDPNAVGRKKGFYDVIDANPDLFNKPIEVATKWDAGVAQAGLQAAMTANPNVDFLYTSSDFLYPTIQGILEPLGKWKPIGDPNHVIMGGLDGDKTACGLMESKFVDATGVQDLYYEADTLLTALVSAVEKGNKQPDEWLDDPGFALTQGNWADKNLDMWGCKLYYGK
jgi:ABC-type sugar transport system substrate-binding protein